MSTSRQLTFDVGQASGMDELAGGNPLFVNAVVDPAGAISARPGVSTWSAFPSNAPSSHPVVGMVLFGDTIVYVTEDKSDLLNPARRLYAWMGFGRGDVISLSDGPATSRVAGTGRPVMIVTRESVLIAGGGAPQRVNSGYVSARLGGSPPNFTDIVATSQFVVGAKNDNSGQFFYAGPGETLLETWDTGIDFREAEYRPDPLVALSETSRELWAHGTKTLQGYEPDEAQVWAPSFNIDVGISAPRSLIAYEGARGWLDHNRRLILTSGRDYGPDSWISSPAIEKSVQRLGAISDCWGFRAKMDAHDLLTWVFPTEGRSFCYDVVSKAWGEWFSLVNGEWAPLAIHSHLWWPERNLHLVGLADGTIGQLSFDAHTDLGRPLKWLVRDGFNSSETAKRKDPLCFKATMRRGEASDADAAISMRWRDDLGPWSEPVSMTFGAAGDSRAEIEVRPVGEPYSVRQYELATTADAATSLTEAWEEYDVVEV